MKFLIDTNILIPLEPASRLEVDVFQQNVAKFSMTVQMLGHSIFLHPAQRVDIEKDKDPERRNHLMRLAEKYPFLDPPPILQAEFLEQIGESANGSNDWVDDNLLGSVFADAVSFLVTNDIRIHRKARKLSLSGRVLDLNNALSFLSNFLNISPIPTPAVKSGKLYNIQSKAEIFNSLRADYIGFDDWFRKGCKDGRDTYYVDGDRAGEYAAIVILKEEIDPFESLKGKIVKICTFKVSDRYTGVKFGELLLKNIFNYATLNSFDGMYLEVYEKHEGLIDLLEDFGFYDVKIDKPDGERRYVKKLIPESESEAVLDPFEYHRLYGPSRVSFTGISAFVVPIQPRFDALLFPERQDQFLFPQFEGIYAFGNSIKKAYICNSNIKKILRGDLLFFYRSQDSKSIVTLGIVENTLRAKSMEDIAKFVGKVTVYSQKEIEILCQNEALAITFRQAILLKNEIPFSWLIENKVLKGPPQSISKISEESVRCIRDRLKILH